MARKGPTSRNKTEQQSLESFFKFLNFEFPKNDEGLLTPTKQSEFMGLIHLYTTFLCQDESKYAFLKFGDKYKGYAGDLLERPSPEAFSEKRDFFTKLQSHIRSKLQTIIETVESKKPEGVELLIEMKGRRSVSVDVEADSFVEAFSPDRIKSKGGLSLATEKSLADLIFLDMVRNAGLKPSRFRRCGRPKCGKFFYQPTEKEKNFCTDKCANADRQYEFRKRQEKAEPKKKAKKTAKRKQK